MEKENQKLIDGRVVNLPYIPTPSSSSYLVQDKKKIGLYPIVGDVIHPGHVAALEEAKRNCDELIVALNVHPDNKKPIQSVYERYAMLRALKCVDEIIPYAGENDLILMIELGIVNYDIRFLGIDYYDKYHDGKYNEQSKGIQFFYLQRTHGLSSTDLKERIIKNGK